MKTVKEEYRERLSELIGIAKSRDGDVVYVLIHESLLCERRMSFEGKDIFLPLKTSGMSKGRFGGYRLPKIKLYGQDTILMSDPYPVNQVVVMYEDGSETVGML